MEKYNKGLKLKIFQIKKHEVLIHKTFGSIKLIYSIFLDKRIKIYEIKKELLSVILKPKNCFY